MRSLFTPLGRVVVVLLLTLNFLAELYSEARDLELQYNNQTNSLDDISIVSHCVQSEISFTVTTDNILSREIEVSIVEDDFILYLKKVVISKSDTQIIKFNSNGLIYKVKLKDHSNSIPVYKEKSFAACNSSNNLEGTRTLSAENYSSQHLKNRFLHGPFGISTARHTEDAHFSECTFVVDNLFKQSDNRIIVDLLSKQAESNIEINVLNLNGQMLTKSYYSIQEGRNLIYINQNTICNEQTLILQIRNKSHTVTKRVPVRY